MHKMARAFCPGMGRASSSRNEMALSSGRVPISSSGRGGGSSSRRGDSRPICHDARRKHVTMNSRLRHG